MKNLRGQCQRCGEPLEFQAEFAGATSDCPHCGQSTELLLASPPEEVSPVRTKAIIFSIVAVIILIGGLGGVGLAMKRAQRLKVARLELSTKGAEASPAGPVNPFAASGFRVSPVLLEHTTNNSLVYAVGTIVSLTNRTRFGIQVELAVLDTTGNPIGATKDYQAVLEPKAEWRFHALVVEKTAAAVRIISVKETH